MEKLSLCKEIGNYFGDYFEENGKLCIDNQEKIFRYDTTDQLLIDWLETIIENHHDTFSIDEYGREWDSWEKQIQFIFEKVIGKYPTGIRVYNGKTKKMFQVEVYKNDGSKHGKMIYLGRFSSIVDAIYAIREYKKEFNIKEEI